MCPGYSSAIVRNDFFGNRIRDEGKRFACQDRGGCVLDTGNDGGVCLAWSARSEVAHRQRVGKEAARVAKRSDRRYRYVKTKRARAILQHFRIADKQQKRAARAAGARASSPA